MAAMGGQGSGVRRILAVILVLVAAASFVVGAVSIAARHTLYEPTNAAGVALRLLDQPAVRLAIAEKLATRIQVLDPRLRGDSEADGLQHLTELLTTTEPFERAFTESVVGLQRDLLEGGAPQVVLRLDGMLTAVNNGLQGTGADLGIDPDRLTGVLVIDRQQVQSYRRVGDVAGQTGWPAIAIGAVAAVGAVLTSERRSSAILGVGATTAVAALAALGGLALAKAATAGQAATAKGQDAVDAVWDAVARDIRTGLAVVLLFGLGAAVTGLAMQAFPRRRLAD
jgi:hypothetical protein